jgi:poly(3-hydroxybutyrate) depolymerase
MKTLSWKIEGVERTAEVYIPEDLSEDVPIMFAFHGHGGTGTGFARKSFQSFWKNCIIAYPNGLDTSSPGDPNGSQTGWQHYIGEINEKTGIKDQDIKFFDAMVDTFVSSYNGNPDCIFPHGWSNGGEFIYDALWSARGEKISAICCASAVLNTTYGKVHLATMHIAGQADKTVPFQVQMNKVNEIIKYNDCIDGVEWATGEDGILATRYFSRLGARVISLKHSEGHAYPDGCIPLIARFFKGIHT